MELLSLLEAAAYLGISEKTMRLWLRGGRVQPVARVGGRWIFQPSDLDNVRRPKRGRPYRRPPAPRPFRAEYPPRDT